MWTLIFLLICFTFIIVMYFHLIGFYFFAYMSKQSIEMVLHYLLKGRVRGLLSAEGFVKGFAAHLDSPTLL